MGSDLRQDEIKAMIAELEYMNKYLSDRIATKQAHPGEDLISVLNQAHIDNDRLTERNILMLTTATMIAGTTPTDLLGGMIHALAERPDQRGALIENPSLIPNAVEEALRWISPTPGLLRTAVKDTEISGQPIAAGQHVYMLFMAGNRDEEIFENPDDFDVRRHNASAHIAFGVGPHFCPGTALARLEAKVLLEELLARFDNWELAEAPTPMPWVSQNGFAALPMKFSPGGA
jgi:cytochrome P450